MKKIKENRNMKVCEQSGYHYKATPTIMLKGQWLKELGFDIGTSISVKCEAGKLIITPREEESFVDAFEELQACMVAEKKEGYC
jgi:toxic protein SymE